MDVDESRNQRDEAEGERERTRGETDEIVQRKEAVIQQLQVYGYIIGSLVVITCRLIFLRTELSNGKVR